MTLNGIANIRLNNQQIVNAKFKTAGDLVDRMGALQAQDYAMAEWAWVKGLQDKASLLSIA